MNRVSSQPLPDQEARDRFCSQLSKNFSVLAPAGVGKTTGIVDRIVSIARADIGSARPILPSLVVVTYTNKAADEMMARARSRMREEFSDPMVMGLLNRAFFGTIHSFCLRLLEIAGPMAGLSSSLAVNENPDLLWERFLATGVSVGSQLPEQLVGAFNRFASWESAMDLAKTWPSDQEALLPVGIVPQIPGGEEILALTAKGRAAESIKRAQQRFIRWRDLALNSETEVPLPEPEPGSSAKALIEAWNITFREFRNWKRETTACVAARIATAYRNFRVAEGEATFDDIILGARKLLDSPEALRILRERNWRVILDEAQDTDVHQFKILTEITRPVGADGDWLDKPVSGEGPRAGHFCMVGDPQQSIYGDRADLNFYLRAHHHLLEEGGEEAVLQTTMRCPVAVVDRLNDVFPSVLTSKGRNSGQVDYIFLETPAGARGGRITRLEFGQPEISPEEKKSVDMLSSEYAEQFAEWLASQSPENLDTDSWSQVAVLCPRNKWVEALASALRARDLPIQVLSRGGIRADAPTHAWWAALLHIFAHPSDAFEIYGVLRDVFGISDSALIEFIDREKDFSETHPLQLGVEFQADGMVAEVLRTLSELRKEILALPLYQGVSAVMRRLQLAERLATIPGERPEDIRRDLDTLLRETAEAEHQQENWIGWAKRCRQRLALTLEAETGDSKSLSLLSCKKAKGLGWDVVILPFFFRGISPPPSRYPFLARGSGETRVILSSAEVDEDWKQARERQNLQEEARLLYVAMTRVKRTLILVDDAEWWKQVGRGTSFARQLQVDEGGFNRRWWESLPPERATADPVEPESFKDPEGGVVTAVRSRWVSVADGDRPPFHPGLRRVTPSSLQLHEFPSTDRDEPDRLAVAEGFEEEVRITDPAAYGNWWHHTMETTPWSIGPAGWQVHFGAALKSCPDPTRGHHELAQFSGSDLAMLLAEGEWHYGIEIPILYRRTRDDMEVFEGFIDFYAERKDGLGRVIDWKTDRVPEVNPEAFLLRAYSSQITVYRDVMRSARSECTMEAGIYSTVLGKWIPIQS